MQVPKARKSVLERKEKDTNIFMLRVGAWKEVGDTSH